MSHLDEQQQLGEAGDPFNIEVVGQRPDAGTGFGDIIDLRNLQSRTTANVPISGGGGRPGAAGQGQKSKLTQAQIDDLTKQQTEAFQAIDQNQDLTDEQTADLKREVTSAILTNADIPHDKASLDENGLSDKDGLISTRWEVSPTSNVDTGGPSLGNVIGGILTTAGVAAVVSGAPRETSPTGAPTTTTTAQTTQTATTPAGTPTTTTTPPTVTAEGETPEAPQVTNDPLTNEVNDVLDSADTDQVKIEKIAEITKRNNADVNDVAEASGIPVETIIAVATAAGVVIAGIDAAGTGEAAPATAEATTAPGTTPATTTTEEDSGSIIPQIIAGIGSLIGTVLTTKAASDASKAQVDASNRALDIFEKNAGIATGRLRETTGEAISTLREGETEARGALTTFGEQARDVITAGGERARTSVTGARDQIRSDLIEAFNFQRGEINNAAVASSGIINEARETAVGNITKGFGEAIGEIRSSRDIANSILQEGTATAEEKLDIARAGAIAAQDRGLSAIRSDFQPFLDAGRVTIEGLTDLVNNPEAQKDFILNNPFFDAIANETERRLLANQAAKGRVGTGETQLELRDRLLAAGNQLLDTAINQRLAVVGVGERATTSVAQAELNRANAVTDIEAAVGDSLATLVQQSSVNRANLRTTAARDIADLSATRGTRLAETETGAARDLAQIETRRGETVAATAGEDVRTLADVELTTAGRVGDIDLTTSAAEAGQIEQEGINLANLATGTAGAVASAQTGLGVNEANITTGTAANLADVTLGKGEAVASGIVGKTTALTSGLTDLAEIALLTPEQRLKLGAAA